MNADTPEEQVSADGTLYLDIQYVHNVSRRLDVVYDLWSAVSFENGFETPVRITAWTEDLRALQRAGHDTSQWPKYRDKTPITPPIWVLVRKDERNQFRIVRERVE